MGVDVTSTEVRVPSGQLDLVADEFAVAEPRGTVLLLHGGGQTRHSWKGTAHKLAAAGWTAVSFDARGHGDSSWATDGDYSMDVLVGDLVAIVERYPNPVFVGASLGGLTSLVGIGEGQVAGRGIVLVDVAPRLSVAGTERIGAFMREHAETGFADLGEVAEAVAAYNPTRSRPASVEGLRRNVRLRGDGRWYWHWDPAFMTGHAVEATRDEREDRLRAAAQGVAVPALIVRGKQSDVLTEEGVRDFLGLVPHARFVDVGGAGHMVAGDDNDVFNEAVIDFLADL